MFDSFASLFRAPRRKRKPPQERSPFSSPYTTAPRSSPIAVRRMQANQPRRRPSPAHDESENDEHNPHEEDRLLDGDEDGDEDEEEEEEDHEEDNEDGNDGGPLLPLFSAAHLDSLPVYNLTHSIRMLIVSRVETTLTWDQLRSPQVSQFLLKPIQQQIRSFHFSRATEYALMTNCLQFTKEMTMYPGLSGNNKTRAMVCELLAMKLLKEFTTRELIDALAYDFYPLQGQGPPGSAGTAVPGDVNLRKHPRVGRISCLEVAIRASAKRFLAHPLVVQQLEAIWAGSIVFHSAADSMHRPPEQVARSQNQNQGYGSLANNIRIVNTGPKLQSSKAREQQPSPIEVPLRRSVTLYDPRDASLFKLSRLRVPRYRNILSTCSFAILLGLFLAVLVESSVEITPLEILFWIWSAGYMLDEIVGFNEQGFSLYLASFWNTFDLGILLLLIIHLCLRIYGIIMPDVRKHSVAHMAYDVLAAAAVLLFPRLFSVLDHYRYFSQLLIAFRIMATDFLAIFVLIIISCSGFFVALTLSFGDDNNDTPGTVAYALLQMLLGFTPAAWERWHTYNALGKTLLVLFMFITHFLVVTILITVLTNSFMAIVQNANEEHQFLFAVNTISMVKSDSLFSYVAPTNIIGWMLTPLRYFIPFRRYVKINRTVIKVTHFPILFSIYLYERFWLRSSVIEPTDLVEARGRAIQPKLPVARGTFLSPRPRRMVREPSIATYQKDRALEEVFRRPYGDSLRQNRPSQERRKTSTAVNNWMNTLEENEMLSPPPEQDRSVLDRLEARRSTLRMKASQSMRNRRDFTDRSVASNPEDYFSNADFMATPRGRRPHKDSNATNDDDGGGGGEDDDVHHTDAEGDDELATNEPDDDDHTTTDRQMSATRGEDNEFMPSTVRRLNYLTDRPGFVSKTPQASRSHSSTDQDQFLSPRTAEKVRSNRQSPVRNAAHRPYHSRHVSTATILYNPVSEPSDERNSSSDNSHTESRERAQVTARNTASARNSAGIRSGTMTPASTHQDGRKTPKRAMPSKSDRIRPIMPKSGSAAFRSAPDLTGLIPIDTRRPKSSGRRTMAELDLGSDIGDNKAIGGGWLAAPAGLPGSYTTQSWMQNADPVLRERSKGRRRHSPDVDVDDDDEEEEGSESNSEDRQAGLFGRLMLARMNTLEEGFREVVNEMRDHLKRDSDKTSSRRPSRSGLGSRGGIKAAKGQVSRKDFATTTSNHKGKEREVIHHPNTRLIPRRRRSERKVPVVRSKGNSEVGPSDRFDASEWVDEDDDENNTQNPQEVDVKTTSSA